MWQDYAITAIQFAFIGALLPAVVGVNKPDKLTSAMNSALLYILALIFLTLSMHVSAISSAMVGVVWTVLLIQKHFSA